MKISLKSGLLLIAIPLLIGCQSTGGGQPGSTSSAQIDHDVHSALAKLYETTPAAKNLAKRAKGILVFPNVLKAGFIGGAQYGDGAMLKNGKIFGYYSIVAGSYGLQAGVQSFSYALFFMNDASLSHLDRSEGFEVGVGPSIVVLDEGMARSVTNTTVLEDIYAFVYGQRGLMAGLGLQGSKITRIRP